jgi:hypothetical protein
MTSNVKTKNYKVDQIERYNFDVKIIFVDNIKKDIIFLMRQALVRNYYGPEILY